MADSEDVSLPADIQPLKDSEYGDSDSELDVTTASKHDITKYAEARIQDYLADNIMDTALWYCFKEDFMMFTVKIFNSMTSTKRTALRNHLVGGGVFVADYRQRRTRKTLAEVLYDVLLEDEPHVWTDEEVAAVQTDDRSVQIRSAELRDKLKVATSTGESRPSKQIPTPYTPGKQYVRENTPPTPTAATSSRARASLGSQLPSQDVRRQSFSIPTGRQSFIRTRDEPSLPPIPETPSRDAPTDDGREPPRDRRPSGNPRSQENQSNPDQGGDRNTRSYGKEIAEVTKMITDDMKYSGHGTEDSLDQKVAVYNSICRRLGVSDEVYQRSFPAILKSTALNYYLNNALELAPIDECCTELRHVFEGPGFHRRNLDKWNEITLRTVANEADNASKSTQECLKIMINRLQELQYGLPQDLKSNDFLHTKIISACAGIPSCKYATSDPPDKLGPLINKLYSSIMNYEKEQTLGGDGYGPQPSLRAHTTEQFPYQTTLRDSRDLELDHTYYTGRRYYQRYGRRDGREPRQGSNQGKTVRFANRNRGASGRCFVCKKEGCWSTNHSKLEVETSRNGFRNKHMGRYNTKGQRFEERLNQYIAAYEGDETDDSEYEELDEIFGDLTLDTGSTDLPYNPDSNTYFTNSISEEGASLIVKNLADRSMIHVLTNTVPANPVDQPAETFNASTVSRYSSNRFQGIMIDTGAAKRSTAGYGQFQALQRDTGIQIDQSTKGKVNIQFGIGTTSSIGSVVIDTPIGQVEFHIVNADTPFLLSLADLDGLKVYFNNLKDVLVTQNGDVPVVRRFGHPFLLWDTTLQSFLLESLDSNPCFLTDVELRRLHRRFGHPSISKLQAVLQRAGHEVDEEALDQLTRFCKHCQKHGKSPGRFKFTLQDDVEFNYCIIVDIMYINGQPLLHIVDQATRFQAGRWLQNISAKHTWDTLRMCWIDSYLGPPDLVATDAGKNFVSREFKQYAGIMGIKIKTVPVEAHNSIGLVERYHGPLRRAYQIISTELRDLDRDAALQMAFKAINDTVGPDGLVPTLLVFGAFPRMTESDPPSPTVAQRTAALRKAMEEVKKLRADRQVSDALSMRNGPRVDAVHDLPLNSSVLVWREGNTGQPGSWTGPYKLISMEGESCVVNLPHGPITFRSTTVKPYYEKEPDSDEDHDDTIVVETPTAESQPLQLDQPVIRPVEQAQPITQPAKRPRGRPRKNPLLNLTAYLQDDEPAPYTASRQSEINGLLEKGVFEIVDPTKLPDNVRIFKSRFVDEVKNKGTDKAFEKSRLVVQAYNDQEKDIVLTQSPTIQRVSQRLILCIAAMLADDEKHLFLRDISQAYVQSTTKLNRDFFISAPIELTTRLGITKGSILKVVKPLYGVPEAGNHWFKTYHTHHLNELGMSQSTYDPCLLYRNKPFGVVGLQTDDTLFVGDAEFADEEQNNLKKAQFLAKDRDQLTPDKPIKFNGGLIRTDADGITLTQERQCENLKPVEANPTTTTSSRGVVRNGLSTHDQYVAQRARGAYIASVCQPQASFDLSYAAQATNPDDNDIKALNKRLQWQKENLNRGLRFVKLDRKSLKLIVFTDSSFANNRDLSSQIGYVIVLADSENRANVIHWSSVKCKRITRSVLASELYGMTNGFDIGASLKATIDKILQIDVPLVLCTDSKSLYECLVKLGTTQEKRLMIDVLCLRQSYERREITEVKWIDGNSNPADTMTKSKASTALSKLIDTNTIELEPVGWVERETSSTGGDGI